MPNRAHLLIRIMATTVVILLIIGLAACRSSSGRTAYVNPAGDCSPDDADQVILKIQPFVEDFSDASSRALSESGIALSPVIADLQRVRRELQRAEIPDCAEVIVGHLSDSYDAAIGGFLALQSDEPNSVVDAKFADALASLRLAKDDLAILSAAR